MRIRVTSTALNAGVLAKECIESVRKQSFDEAEWTHDFFDAKSDDDTYEQARLGRKNDLRVRVHRNEVRKSVFENLLPLWRSFDDNDIIVWLDGDDRLATHAVFDIIYEVHKSGALITYGQYQLASGQIGIAAQVGDDPRSETWRATHLKTFRAGLVKRIRDEDFRDPTTGDYVRFATDQTVMFPLLEMAPHHAAFIPHVLHIYNEQHGHMARSPQDLEKELAVVRHIRSLPRYNPLDNPRRGPRIASTGYWGGSDAHEHHNCSKPLANWIANYLGDQKDTRVYDFGCGVGAYLEVLHTSGFRNLLGFEGDPPQVRRFKGIKQHDLTKPLVLPPEDQGNVVCLEVAEHIPAEFEDVFLDNVTGACKKGGRLIMSWAVRGQGGDGHVNCLDNHEAIEHITRRGFKLLVEETKAARSVITDLPWFADTTLVFKKCATRTGKKIPKIIHQIWIGPLPPPEKLMTTWKTMHPDWEYRLWTSEQGWENQAKIDAMLEWNGKADIMRYEILEKFGGVLVDADSECVQPLDESFLEHEAFACWEHELVRFGLIATGYVGSAPGTPLMRVCIDVIKQAPLVGRAWQSVGPLFFTAMAKNFPLHVFPSRMFIPKHQTGVDAPGDAPIYAKQFWGSTFGYESIAEQTGVKKPRKLEIGCGPLPTPGYEHNDLNAGPGVDHVGPIQELEFPDGTFIEVYGNGCVEHLTFQQAIKFLKKAIHWLTPGGMLHFNVPDMVGWMRDEIHGRKDAAWRKAAFEGWCRWPGDEHKSFWTEQLVVMTLHEIGYEKIDVYQRWAYAGPEDWHVCVKAYKPTYPLTVK